MTRTFSLFVDTPEMPRGKFRDEVYRKSFREWLTSTGAGGALSQGLDNLIQEIVKNFYDHAMGNGSIRATSMEKSLIVELCDFGPGFTPKNEGSSFKDIQEELYNNWTKKSEENCALGLRTIDNLLEVFAEGTEAVSNFVYEIKTEGRFYYRFEMEVKPFFFT